jgi:hypothetical protein
MNLMTPLNSTNTEILELLDATATSFEVQVLGAPMDMRGMVGLVAAVKNLLHGAPLQHDGAATEGSMAYEGTVHLELRAQVIDSDAGPQLHIVHLNLVGYCPDARGEPHRLALVDGNPMLDRRKTPRDVPLS